MVKSVFFEAVASIAIPCDSGNRHPLIHGENSKAILNNSSTIAALSLIVLTFLSDIYNHIHRKWGFAVDGCNRGGKKNAKKVMAVPM